ncbi:hypothetical protein MCEMSHM24_02718 [Comamonadaceae bacterium]
MSLLANYSNDQLAAFKRLFDMAFQHLGTGGGNTCAKVLLGLYNGRRFPMEMTDLRYLDLGNLDAAMTVIRADSYRTYAEVHDVLDAIRGFELPSTQSYLENWAYLLRLKGRCTKGNLPSLAKPAAAEAS